MSNTASANKTMIYEIYLYEDQINKKNFGGHVRFVTATSEDAASHKVAFDHGHWWRICGIRQVDFEYLNSVQNTLITGSAPHKHAAEAYSLFTETY